MKSLHTDLKIIYNLLLQEKYQKKQNYETASSVNRYCLKLTVNAILYWWLNLFQRVVSSRVRARANIFIGAYVHLFCRLWIILGVLVKNLNSIIGSKFIKSISEIHIFYFSIKFAGSQVVLDLNRCTEKVLSLITFTYNVV